LEKRSCQDWALTQYFRSKRMNQVTPEDLEAFLDHEQSTHGLSHHTRNHYLSLVKSIYNRLRKWRMYRGDNPAEYIEMKKIPRARVRFLYPAEEKQLTPVVLQDSIVWPHYVTALHTGMRIGEIVRMKVEDIAFATQTIFVPTSKSSRSRYVPLSEELASFLTECTVGKNPSDYALAGVTASYVSRRFGWLCEQAGVVNLKFHDLRHTFASRLLSRGVPIYKVSKILGHSSVVVTEQHYGHLSLADMSVAISRIEGVVTFAADLQRTPEIGEIATPENVQIASTNHAEVL
jgi:integrase